jgi:hypothetical protein
VTTNAARRPNCSPLQHVPCDDALQGWLDNAERRWSADRFKDDHDVRVLTDWIWDTEASSVGLAQARLEVECRSCMVRCLPAPPSMPG